MHVVNEVASSDWWNNYTSLLPELIHAMSIALAQQDVKCTRRCHAVPCYMWPQIKVFQKYMCTLQPFFGSVAMMSLASFSAKDIIAI